MSKALKNKVKLNDTVSVKDFGAVGDGVTDDLAAFTLALAASDYVYVPPGTYRITDMRMSRSDDGSNDQARS